MEKKFRLFLLLALLMTAVTGAWAQTETLLTTIESTANQTFTNGSKTFDEIATVTFSAEVSNDGDNWGWFSNQESDNQTITVTAASDAYTITRVKFYSANGSAFDEEAPFLAIVRHDGNNYITKVNGTSIGRWGLNKIEVYGYEGAATPPASSTYTVSLKDGTQDADKWTVKAGTDGSFQSLPLEGVKAGTKVKLKYDGDRSMLKGVKAKIEYPEPAANSVDLSKLTTDYEAQDGEVLTGTLGANVKISIAAGATVTLDGVTINGVKSKDFKWAGITCVGDATIILKDGTTNTVMGFKADYPGIFIASDKTLTIKGETAGTGSLNARSNGSGAGIGGGYQIACGNIEIQGGVITATGGSNSAGIGSGRESSCGNITISGGSVTATGGANGAGIGSGYAGSCGNITITTGVTQVTATKGDYAPNSIGKAEGSSSCGTVTIGGSVTGNITTSPYTYQPSN